MINKNTFLERLNYVKPTYEFNLDVNMACYHKYEDLLDAPFFHKAYH